MALDDGRLLSCCFGGCRCGCCSGGRVELSPTSFFSSSLSTTADDERPRSPSLVLFGLPAASVCSPPPVCLPSLSLRSSLRGRVCPETAEEESRESREVDEGTMVAANVLDVLPSLRLASEVCDSPRGTTASAAVATAPASSAADERRLERDKRPMAIASKGSRRMPVGDNFRVHNHHALHSPHLLFHCTLG